MDIATIMFLFGTLRENNHTNSLDKYQTTTMKCAHVHVSMRLKNKPRL